MKDQLVPSIPGDVVAASLPQTQRQLRPILLCGTNRITHQHVSTLLATGAFLEVKPSLKVQYRKQTRAVLLWVGLEHILCIPSILRQQP